ncbi:MAG: MgtC/SapB family protein [Anaerolineaceae bacterium]|jgi:putative Mg2+ transporter-C (MgtC) family protein
MTVIPFNEILLRIGLSLVLGGVIGFERERDNQPAGLRTHMILVIGACLAMILSINMGVISGNDPARIAAQVISGIGFLGAGAILRYGFNVKGLTTATTLWTMAIVGLVLGAGYYWVAIISTVVMLVVLAALDQIEKKHVRVNVVRNIVVDLHDRKSVLREVRKTIQSLTEKVMAYSIQKSVKNKHLRLELTARFKNREKLETLVEELSEIDGVRALKIE